MLQWLRQRIEIIPRNRLLIELARMPESEQIYIAELYAGFLSTPEAERKKYLSGINPNDSELLQRIHDTEVRFVKVNQSDYCAIHGSKSERPPEGFTLALARSARFVTGRP